MAAGKNKVASLVEDMLNAVQSEMGRYQRIITYWPCCELGQACAWVPAAGFELLQAQSVATHVPLFSHAVRPALTNP